MISAVAEVQGLYGPFSFHERLLQKLWLRGEFDCQDVRTHDGRPLDVLYSGRWNQLGGPDFKSARIRLNGQVIVGDIEIHLKAQDWRTHGHAYDRAYDGVVLHVVLFPTNEAFTPGADGRQIPIFALLPHLRCALEEYAADEAVERMADRASSRALDAFAELSEDERQDQLGRFAEARWRQKARFAELRVQKLGWENACHQTALEVMGYRFNRAPMLRIGAAYEFRRWSESLQPSLVEEAYAGERERWILQGVRPANLPLTRLRQYASWTSGAADWPKRLMDWRWSDNVSSSDPFRFLAGQTKEFRRSAELGNVRREIARQLCGGAIGGTRLDTLVCDAFLPLIKARVPAFAAEAFWFHWFPGDLPPHLAKTLQQIGMVSRRQPLCHGLAQALLGWWIEHEKAGGLGPEN